MESFQHNMNSNGASPREDGLDFKKLVHTFLQYWLWFFISIFICISCALLYLRYATPVYKVTSKILIKDDKSSPASSSGDLLGELDIFNTKNNVNNEKQVLQTYYLVKKVVDELQLNISYFAVGNIKLSELYKKNFFKIQLVSLKDSIPPQIFDLKFSDNGSEFTIENDSLHGRYRLNDTIKTT